MNPGARTAGKIDTSSNSFIKFDLFKCTYHKSFLNSQGVYQIFYLVYTLSAKNFGDERATKCFLSEIFCKKYFIVLNFWKSRTKKINLFCVSSKIVMFHHKILIYKH